MLLFLCIFFLLFDIMYKKLKNAMTKSRILVV